jgi:hypothetical protein
MDNLTETLKAIGKLSGELAAAFASIATASIGVLTAYHAYLKAKHELRKKRKSRKAKAEKAVQYKTDEAS